MDPFVVVLGALAAMTVIGLGVLRKREALGIDRFLVVLGSLAAMTVVGLGVLRTQEAHADRPSASLGAVAAVRPPYAAAPAPATVSDVLRGMGSTRVTRVTVPPGSREVDWATLTAYEYAPGLSALPDTVKALEGQVITMRGFLMPLYEYDDIREFVLVPNHMSCCFGMPIGINGQVLVKLDMSRGLPNTNEPLEVTGTFRASETKEQGYVLSIYRMDGAKARIVGY
jgi:hypothetical protein